jgi:glycosyltransferase involved in cell wall biosynthesis
MPTRNNVNTVGEALTSVLGQSFAPSVVVVIDAASTDGTVEIVASTPDVCLVKQDGLGLGAARNEGIAALDTELVAFCDADDRWTPGSLAVRVDHLMANPGCAAVTGGYLPLSADADQSGEGAIPAESSEQLALTNKLALRPALTPGGVLIRRDALAEIGPFATDLRIATDSDWLVRLRQRGLRLDVIDEVVLLKGRRSTSLSAEVDAYRIELLTVARNFVRRRR